MRPLAIAIATLIASQAQAAPVCKNRAAVIEILKRQFEEHPQGYYLQDNGAVLEMYASASGTWTAVLSSPSGKACIVGAGKAWRGVDPPKPGQPA